MAANLTQFEIDAQQAASRFGNVSYMRTYFPALFATEAHPKMSERYAFTNTYDIVQAMHEKGYCVSSIAGGDTRFSKMLIRMRHEMYMYPDKDARGAPEVCIMDSHDGSRGLLLALGWIEFLCMNGCIAGDMIYKRRFIHNQRDLMAHVMLELQDIGQYIDTLTRNVEDMRNYRTTIAERMHLADIATIQRFGTDHDEAYKTNMRHHLLMRRRREDTAEDLHTVVNVIQENAIRGGFRYNSGTRANNGRGTMLNARAVNDVAKNVNINTALWNEATQLMKAAA